MTRPEFATATSQRLFFALWPSPELQSLIFNYAQPLAAETAARPSPVDNLHLTLLFLGQVSEEVQGCLEQAVAELTLPRFDLKFAHLIHRHRQQMLWLQPEASPPCLLALVTALRRVATACGLKTDPRPFCAHLTLLRKVTRVAVKVPCPDFVWPVQAFALVASKTLPTGAEYRIVKKWHLAG